MKGHIAAISMLVVAISSSGYAQISDVDWKLYGGAAVSGQSFCFYEARGITRQPAKHVRVWTKCLSKADLDTAFESDPDKKIVEATAKKVAAYYVPPIAMIQNLDANDAMVMTGYEEVADLGNVQAQSQIFYELNCPDRMLRELSIDLHINGKVGAVNKPSDWKYVAPEGNAATLIKLLCPG
jgi:hypothetical protein